MCDLQYQRYHGDHALSFEPWPASFSVTLLLEFSSASSVGLLCISYLAPSPDVLVCTATVGQTSVCVLLAALPALCELRHNSKMWLQLLTTTDSASKVVYFSDKVTPVSEIFSPRCCTIG